MFKSIKTLFVCAGLLAGLLSAAPVMATKTGSDAAPTAATASATEVSATNAKAPAITPVVQENPYGLKALWAQGDMVAKSTLLIMVIMSMGSWYVIFIKLAEQNKLGKQAKEAHDKFWSASTMRQGADALEEASAFRFIADKGLEGAEKHNSMMGAVDFNTWVSMSIQRAIGNVQSRMQNGLAFLATVGSTAPFVGLFGTVWGIYHALVKIGISGQASIDKVAGPVGESLIMTAIGLAVAVPAVLGYNWLVRRNKAVLEQLNAFGSDLYAVLLISSKK
jgi:biopolymer transport protein ExbB